MAAKKLEPKLDIPPLDIVISVSSAVDNDTNEFPEPAKEIRSNPEFERAIRGTRRDFKQNVLWDLKSRHTFFDPRRDKSRRRTSVLPPPIDDQLAEIILRHVDTAKLVLDGVRELPSGDNIVGAVAIVRKRELDEFLCSLDKWKHKRWGFPGGRCDPNDLNIAHTLLRELKEEIGLRGQRFRYTFVALVPLVVAPDKTSAVFFTEIPEEIAVKVRAGREQHKLQFFSRAEIHEMILKRKFLENHANYLFAWEHLEKSRSPR